MDKYAGKSARVANVRDRNVEEFACAGAGGVICKTGERRESCGAAGSGSAGLSGALNDPAIYLALNTLGPAICHKP